MGIRYARLRGTRPPAVAKWFTPILRRAFNASFSGRRVHRPGRFCAPINAGKTIAMQFKPPHRQGIRLCGWRLAAPMRPNLRQDTSSFCTGGDLRAQMNIRRPGKPRLPPMRCWTLTFAVS